MIPVAQPLGRPTAQARNRADVWSARRGLSDKHFLKSEISDIRTAEFPQPGITAVSQFAPSPPLVNSPAVKPRFTAKDRDDRRMRIFARLQEGWSYEAIAAREGLTRERIRQIAAETLAGRSVDASRDHLRLQIARLDPALRLAAEQVAAGDLRAVDRLLRVLDRLDKYQGAAAAMGDGRKDNRAYEELLTKLGRMAARRDAAVAAVAAGAKAPGSGERRFGEPSAAARGGEAGGGEMDNAIARFFPPEVVENAGSGRG